jgi:hypothetical protein
LVAVAVVMWFAYGGLGGSGLVILRYPNAYTITFGAGVTGTTAVLTVQTQLQQLLLVQEM